MSDDDALRGVAATVARRFAIEGTLADVRRHPGGHIHDSFVATIGDRRWLLQRLNAKIFPQPERVMENLVAITGHLARTAASERSLHVIPARDGSWLVRDPGGSAWRAFAYIEDAITRPVAASADEVEGAAYAFGHFQSLLADYAGPRLHVTIANFHDTPARYVAFDRAVRADVAHRAAGAAPEIALATAWRADAGALERARAGAPIRERIAHHDAKIANILFDRASGEPLCIVDLDTTMPGLPQVDFGDLVRSLASGAAEDERDLARAMVDPERVRAIARGYLRGAGALLNEDERALLPIAARVIVLEQGVRFLTDHLEGDRYYRIDRAGQNLDRCRTQFALLTSLEALGSDFARMVEQP